MGACSSSTQIRYEKLPNASDTEQGANNQSLSNNSNVYSKNETKRKHFPMAAARTYTLQLFKT
jgi:hypothetical protein